MVSKDRLELFGRDEKTSLCDAIGTIGRLLWRNAAGAFIDRSSEMWKVP
jgi:hypothetical protein